MFETNARTAPRLIQRLLSGKSQGSAAPKEKIHLLQKLLKILAALSLSLSKVVGQNASLPILFDSLLTGAPSLSAQPQTLSKPFLLPDLVLSQDGSIEVTFCIAEGNETPSQRHRDGLLKVRSRMRRRVLSS
jgi:hypothetical protein